MILQFGNVKRPIYENGITIDRSGLVDGKGELYAHQIRLGVSVRLLPKEDNSIDQQIQAIESLYDQTADSFAILYDDETPTAHVFPRPGKVLSGGVRLSKPLSYLKFQNGEHVSYRTAGFELECIELVQAFADKIIEFSESLDTDGGGPIFGHLQPNEGLATKQQLRTNELWKATQSGRIVHLGRYGIVPPPIFPGALIGRPQIRRETPRRIANSYIGFPTSYTYRFENATPLNGVPNTWFD